MEANSDISSLVDLAKVADIVLTVIGTVSLTPNLKMFRSDLKWTLSSF